MSKTSTSTKGSAEQAVRRGLSARPGGTAAEVASAAGVGRSTASKALAELERRGKARRKAGGRDGRRRLPDRWTLAGRKRRGVTASSEAAERLAPGALDDLVLGYMRKHRADGPLGPGMIAKGLGRSSGAVANCLVRLDRDGQVRQVGDSPLRYTLA